MDKDLQNKLSWLILIGVSLIFLVSLYLYTNRPVSDISTLGPDSTPSTNNADLIKRLNTIYGTDNSYNAMGNPKAKVTIVEFGDFTCPYCRASAPILRELALKHPDQIQVIFRDRTPTEKSVGLALASHCAGEQNQFWPMHDLLYQYQSEELGQDEASIIALAQKLTLDQKQFQNCLDTRKYLNTIKKNMVDSERLALSGTPSWYINGLEYPGGTLDQAAFEDYLNNLLN